MMRHYIGNEGETGRQWTSSNIDDRTAHELYVWPFQDAVHAGCVSAMCAYNGLNGTYSCADPVSLGKWLHEELNFQGWVLSDFGSVYEDTEVASANAGLDSVIGATTLAYGREGDRLPSQHNSGDEGLLADLQTHLELIAPFPEPSRTGVCPKLVLTTWLSELSPRGTSLVKIRITLYSTPTAMFCPPRGMSSFGSSPPSRLYC
jgi:hypothetical protein